MICDSAGDLVYVNPAWTRVYGYSRDEALGKNPRLIHSGVQSESFYRDMWEKIRDPQTGTWKGELVNKAKNGVMIPVFLTITPFRSQNSRTILGYMGIAVDMTYKREMESKVAHQDRLASIGLLASGLAHEIGTPLGVIRGRAELLSMKLSDDNLKRELGVITSEIDRITKLIRSLLRISRSHGEAQNEIVDPSALASSIFSLIGEDLRRDSVDIRLKISPATRVLADANRLEQVFLNLIMNSIHAIQQVIKTGRSGPNFIELDARSLPNGTTELSVSDSGCGIRPENLPKLFQPFYTTKDIGEGTGLGLTIVSQLVREMKGEIAVESAVDQGTTFTLTLQSA